MDLSQYTAARAHIEPCDLIVCYGTELLSRIIEIEDGGPSHSMAVRQGLHPGADVRVIQSTIESGKNGVQSEPLADVLASYPSGTRVDWYPLRPAVRAGIDWQKFYEICGAADGIVRYDIPGLFGFLLRQVPILGSYEKLGSNPKREVCSVFVSALFEGCGVTRGVCTWKTTPTDLIRMPLYRAPVCILGKKG